jgi:hypothetical protein
MVKVEFIDPFEGEPKLGLSTFEKRIEHRLEVFEIDPTPFGFPERLSPKLGDLGCLSINQPSLVIDPTKQHFHVPHV